MGVLRRSVHAVLIGGVRGRARDGRWMVWLLHEIVVAMEVWRVDGGRGRRRTIAMHKAIMGGTDRAALVDGDGRCGGIGGAEATGALVRVRVKRGHSGRRNCCGNGSAGLEVVMRPFADHGGCECALDGAGTKVRHVGGCWCWRLDVRVGDS